MQKNKYNILNIVKLCVIPMLFIFPVDAYFLNGTILNNSDSTGLSNTLIIQNNSQYLYNSTGHYYYWTNSTMTNSTGYFSLSNASSGNFTFSNNPKFYQNISNITITENTIRNVNLTIKPTGTITGYVFWGSYSCAKETIIQYSNRIMWFI